MIKLVGFIFFNVNAIVLFNRKDHLNHLWLIEVFLLLHCRAQFAENRSIFNTPNPRLMNVSLLKESKLFSSASDRKKRSSSAAAAAGRSIRRVSSSVISAAAAAAAAHLAEDCPAPIHEEADGRPKLLHGQMKSNEMQRKPKQKIKMFQTFHSLRHLSSLPSSCLAHTVFASTLVLIGSSLF